MILWVYLFHRYGILYKDETSRQLASVGEIYSSKQTKDHVDIIITFFFRMILYRRKPIHSDFDAEFTIIMS
jgi:hypothetical protein